jgi:hypothetical protein
MYHERFGSLLFPKRGAQIKGRARKKLSALRKKMKYRESRIEEITKKAGLGKAADLLSHMDDVMDRRFTNTVAVGSSGEEGGIDLNVSAKGALMAEVSALRGEKAEAEKLNLLVRNLPSARSYDLNFEDLDYLGF